MLYSMDGSDAGNSEQGRRNKVASLIEKYELDPLGDELVASWTAEGENRQSLRDLADYFNKQLLRKQLNEGGLQTLDREPSNIYRLLTDEDVSSADRTRARRKLERKSIDVDTLLKEFVSYQAIRTYLQDYRGVEYTGSTAERTDVAADNIQRLRGRTQAVTEQKLTQLQESGDISIGEFQTIIEISIICEDCESQYSITELFERGACECDEWT